MNEQSSRGVNRSTLSSFSAKVGATLLATFAGAAASDAGTIRHDRPDSAYRALAAEPQFASVGYYGAISQFGSFTLIAPNWALTAAHVVDVDADGLVSDEGTHTLRIGAQSRTATQYIVPTGVGANRGWSGDINNGFDIALVRFDTPFVGIAPASLYTSFQELGQTVTQVGYGRTGTGQTGATTGGGTSSKRAGDNVVDRFVNFSNGATALGWDFDEPSTDGSPRVSRNHSGSSQPLDLEYLIAGGDSGGGSFIFENDMWSLAGVHSGTYNFFNYPGAASDASTYGDGALVTRVAAYQQFVYSNIPELAVAVPEPGSVAVLVLAGFIALRGRRRPLF